MGLNPLDNNRRELPAFKKINGDFHFIFRRNPNAYDLSYHVEASSDLRDWQEIYAPQVPILPDGIIDPHSEQVSMNLSEHLTNGFRFFRLRISRYGD